jgi:dihydropyrimidinase
VAEKPFFQVDTAILGGTLVRPGRMPAPGNLGIRDGKIVTVTDPDLEFEAAETFDASGAYVFPGVIEPHAHWGLGDGLADLLTESTSSAYGGITTTLFFLRKNEPYDPLYREMVEQGEARSVIDFGLHAVLMNEAHLDEIDHYVDDFGITSFKCYFTYRGEDAAFMGVDDLDDGFLLEAFRRVAHNPKGLVLAHCENIELVHRARARLKADGRDDMRAWQLSRPVVAEVDGVRRAMLFAEEAGARLNILHLTSAAALEEVEAFRRRYPDVYVEVCHSYLTWNGDGELSRAAKMKPPLRTTEDNDSLWHGAAGGSVNTIGSDHVPRRLEAKAGSIWNPYTGCPGSATLLPVLLSEGHHKRGIPLTRIAELTALNPALLYGLYPRKGSLEVGADADLGIVDLEVERVVRAQDLLSYADYSLYEGWTLKGWPTHTMVRGRWVMVDHEVVGRPGTGCYVPR